jgi:hypothetical protein
LQLSWFFSVENVCGAQTLHVRSAVLLALASTASPGGQVSAPANGTARELVQKYAGGHGSHDPLATLPKLPVAHDTWQAADPALLKVLQSQRVHARSALNPTLNCPAGQALQTEAPDVEEALIWKPGAQTDALQEEAPFGQGRQP